MSNKNKIPVYAPGSNEPQYETRLNAYDLVNGAGYTWKPNTPTTPASFSPARVVQPKGAEPAQAVLDAHGHNSARALGAGADTEADDENEVEPEVEAAPEPEPVVEAAPAAETEKAPAPARRGRSK